MEHDEEFDSTNWDAYQKMLDEGRFKDLKIGTYVVVLDKNLFATGETYDDAVSNLNEKTGGNALITRVGIPPLMLDSRLREIKPKLS